MLQKYVASFALAVVLVACSDSPVTGPSATATPPPEARENELLTVVSGVEYEMDTGEVSCPAILNSHVKYWVNINAVGPRLFTFFAPHVRQTYLGRGVYRYRMTLGRSDDDQWLAAGSWTGKCIGYAQWGIGRVLSFEGTVWPANSDSGGGCDGGAIKEPVYMESDEPGAENGELTANCGGATGGNSGGGYECSWDYITIEISYDGGATWQDYWSGWSQVCESLAA